MPAMTIYRIVSVTATIIGTVYVKGYLDGIIDDYTKNAAAKKESK